MCVCVCVCVCVRVEGGWSRGDRGGWCGWGVGGGVLGGIYGQNVFVWRWGMYVCGQM